MEFQCCVTVFSVYFHSRALFRLYPTPAPQPTVEDRRRRILPLNKLGETSHGLWTLFEKIVKNKSDPLLEYVGTLDTVSKSRHSERVFETRFRASVGGQDPGPAGGGLLLLRDRAGPQGGGVAVSAAAAGRRAPKFRRKFSAKVRHPRDGKDR